MPEFSQRALNLPASPIRKLVPFAEAAKKRGVNVYHLNIGQPDITTPPNFWEAIRKADLDVLAYSPSAGTDSFRKAICSYYERLGPHLDPRSSSGHHGSFGGTDVHLYRLDESG